MSERRKREMQDLTVREDGTVLVPAEAIARLGLASGASVRVIPTTDSDPVADLFEAGDRRRREAGLAPLTDEDAAAAIDPIIHEVRSKLNQGEQPS